MSKLIIILAYVLIFSFKASADEVTAGYCGPKDENGNYGTNCEWNYDASTKTLKIWGTGGLYNSSGLGQHPWSRGTSYYNDIENVVIEEGITSIGNHAFYSASSLQNVVLPDSLKNIGWNVFNGGTKIKSVVIPASVNYIGGSSKSNWPFSQLIEDIYCSEGQTELCFKAIAWSKLDEGVLKTYKKYGNEYFYDGKFYYSPKDIGLKKHIRKRSYSPAEAALVSGEDNTIVLYYK